MVPSGNSLVEFGQPGKKNIKALYTVGKLILFAFMHKSGICLLEFFLVEGVLYSL